ncbi:hypothetical protein SAMN05216388_1001229 [Halorientalis persicus]|uniref:Uncharacterized protein n=1 Tax=Halorientalis persicus TaxID=1367881 RepID=A0A1H8DAI9_9EURY|nr:hypothetical protein [Halorientalis persicus]SEN04269.1 hypothetical protein SAMN05216388_1001229 [Halorientalis persicus]
MPVNTRGKVGEIDNLETIQDADDSDAHPASDERLEEVRQQGQNHSGLVDGQYTVDQADTAESLPDQPIPDGIEVVVAYDPANDGVVYAGDGSPSYPLTDVGQALTLRVDNLSVITIEAGNMRDGVRYIAEVSN